MACNHTNLSSPVTVSLCLTEGEIECCPDEFETMVVCKDCGYYKITAVQEVCEECCGKDATIWDSYLNTWHNPDGSEGWSGANLGFNLINYSVYQNTFNAISSCEFMVDGYHYTEPTLSGSTDSCRIYIDTDKAGEDSEVVSNTETKHEIISETFPDQGQSLTYILKESPAENTSITVCLWYDTNFDGTNSGDTSFPSGASFSELDYDTSSVDIIYDGDKSIGIVNTFGTGPYVACSVKYQVDRPIWITPTTATKETTNPSKYKWIIDDFTIGMQQKVISFTIPENVPLELGKHYFLFERSLTQTNYENNIISVSETFPFGTSFMLVDENPGMKIGYNGNRTFTIGDTYLQSAREVTHYCVIRLLENDGEDYISDNKLHLKGIHGFYVQT